MSEVQPNTSVSLERVQKSLNKNGVALKGVINVPEFGRAGELLSLNQKFRNSLDLYANVCKVESLPGVKSRHKDVDLIIIREQTEGEYSALEHESIPGVVECLKVVTAEKSRRIAKVLFSESIITPQTSFMCSLLINKSFLNDFYYNFSSRSTMQLGTVGRK